MWLGLILLTLLLVSPSESTAADASMRASLHNFFERGVQHEGAMAEFVEVLRWPDAKGTLRWRLPHLRNHPERVSLIAEQGKGAQVRRWYVPVQLRWWADAIAVRGDVATHTLLMPSMLQGVRADIAGHAGRWWSDARQLSGTRTTRPLRAEQVIYESYVKRPPLLIRGDHITLVSISGSVRVATMGEVLKPASRGDRVQVRNLSSKQVLQAVVVDRHTARVLAGGA